MADPRETVLEIDLGALEHNYRYLKARIEPKTKFLAVVKAYAYGSDSIAIARKLEALGVDYFAVAYTHEGAFLRDHGIITPILVLHPQPVNFDQLIARCLEPSIYSDRILKAFQEAAKAAGQRHYPVHLKFNTGLNRLGFREEDIPHIAMKAQQSEALKVISLFSHLAASDDRSESVFTHAQIDRFKSIVKKISGKLDNKPFLHLLNTSGILNYPEAQFDMVRSGIGLYGYSNNPDLDQELKPVATLKTVISQIHEITPGESVGYNRAFTARNKCTIATLPLGHADGLGRIYGNARGVVSVNGQKAPIVGNVCMDMLMIDISGIPCDEGDEVILFGKGHSAEMVAASAKTISYELITGISQRVRREILP
ncbi:alanine racemase [Lentiprolixibacter aurantiacus]|uniref:Alanine racemase n=1 Tax=Lentiprolixibacter aurantiacus TaxID=2993939 RepID=A0AAE3SMG1_9FLAO|nr:alanine racemase [Lentiprolixibacter aurantiacus]MCX2718410.1 alanine racemase [Lentiprolixibacter aurantiacus]